MSKSLVKKAFALAEQDSRSGKPQTDEQVSRRKASALELIPRHQKLVQLVGKKGNRTEKDLIRRREKLTVTDVRQQLASRRDHTEENVRKLLRLSSSSLDDETRERMLKRARTGRYVTSIKLTKKGRGNPSTAQGDATQEEGDDANEAAPGETVFTEEDFASFAKALERSGL